MHDDYLDDFTCVNTLKFRELKKRLDQVSTLKRILQTARRYTQKRHSDRPGGQVIIEIKTPSPLCAPADSTVPDLVKGVLKNVKHMKMAKQVLLESFSPEILALSKEKVPNIPTMLMVLQCSIDGFLIFSPLLLETPCVNIPMVLGSEPFLKAWLLVLYKQRLK